MRFFIESRSWFESSESIDIIEKNPRVCTYEKSDKGKVQKATWSYPGLYL